MTASILFIDSNHAKIFKLIPAKMETSELKKHGDSHPSDDNKTDEYEKHFFTDVTSQLKDASQLLIVGPGQAKTRFKTHLENHQQALAKNIVGVETIDQLSDAKIIEVGRKFFKEYDLFH